MRLMWIYIVVLIVSSYSVNAHVKIITDLNWKDFMKDEWMILLYAPWCPACQAIKPDWEVFAAETSNFKSINVGSIDITKNPVVAGSFSISHLPTFFHIKDGVFRQYTGDRRSFSLIKFINERGYESIKPLEWYYNPSSFQMRAVGHLFHLSQIIMNIQEILSTKYGLSAWMAYVIIGGIIVVAGISVSLLFFCLMIAISKIRSRKVVARTPERSVRRLPAMDWESENLQEPKDMLRVETKVGQISLDGDNQVEDESEAEEKKTK